VRADRMTMADLANYESRLRQPLHTTSLGYDIYGMRPRRSGGAGPPIISLTFEHLDSPSRISDLTPTDCR
jgi:gamma-glutamyltranspeptidase